MNEKKREKTYLDVIKILAIFFVIYNHTGQSGFFRFSELQRGNVFYLLYMVLAAVCKVAVPLFLMVSGALLGGKQESIRELFKKRIVRYGIILIAFSMVCYLYDTARNGSWIYFDILKFFRKIYSEPIVSSYWFMYMYITLLVILPFLRPMVCHMSKSAFQYLFVLQIVFRSLLPMLEYIFLRDEYHVNIDVLFVTDIIFYFAMGYYYEHIREESDEKYDKGLLVLAILMILCTCFMIHYEAGLTGEYTERFIIVFLAGPTIFIFQTIRKVCRKHFAGVKSRQMIASMGSCIFIIYLTEYILRDLLEGMYIILQQHIPIILASILYVLTVMVTGYIVAVVLRKIPVINHFL